MEDTLIAVVLAYNAMGGFIFSSGSPTPVGYCDEFDGENREYVYADVQAGRGAGPQKLGLWVEMQDGIRRHWLLQPDFPLGCSCPPSCGSIRKTPASNATAAPSYTFQLKYERRYEW